MLEHNRLDLVSLAAVTARAVRLVEGGADGCRDGAQALALGRIYERAGLVERADRLLSARGGRAMSVEVQRGRPLSARPALPARRAGSSEAAAIWREIVALSDARSARRNATARSR